MHIGFRLVHLGVLERSHRAAAMQGTAPPPAAAAQAASATLAPAAATILDMTAARTAALPTLRKTLQRRSDPRPSSQGRSRPVGILRQKPHRGGRGHKRAGWRL